MAGGETLCRGKSERRGEGLGPGSPEGSLRRALERKAGGEAQGGGSSFCQYHRGGRAERFPCSQDGPGESGDGGTRGGRAAAGPLGCRASRAGPGLRGWRFWRKSRVFAEPAGGEAVALL